MARTKTPININNAIDVSNWFARSLQYDWNHLTNAWDDLISHHADICTYSSTLFENLSMEFIRNKGISQPHTDLIDVIHSYPRIRRKHIRFFNFLVKRAGEQLDLHHKYLSDLDLMQHDSSIEFIMGTIPKFKRIKDWEYRALIEETILPYVKDWYRTKLYYEYVLFLRDSNLIKNNTCSSALKIVQETQIFKDMKFGELTPFDLSNGMEFYRMTINSLEMLGHDEETQRELYNYQVSNQFQSDKDRFLKYRSSLPPDFRSPIHFLVHRARHEGYVIGDPMAEITKLRAYFGLILRGLPDWICHRYFRCSLNRRIRVCIT